ncbi:MAG: ribulokinase [Planctomycetota bacterium]
MSKFAIGIDYGTESGRAVLVNIATGAEVAQAVLQYPHGVMDRRLPDGTPLAKDWALQHPADYLAVIYRTVPAVLKQGRVKAADVVGIGIDFTACTMLPVKADGTPLCFLNQFKSNPHAYVKLWKHHAAQPEADRINALARKRGEKWLKFYGGRISSEWFFAKALQILDEAPRVYRAADRLIEAADWTIWQLTGVETRNACTAGYKAIWDAQTGYPSREYLRALDPAFADVVRDKMAGPVLPIGARAGGLTAAMAKKTGLRPGTAVAVANVDAHVSVPPATITSTGKMLMIMGTSICHMVLGKTKKAVEGQCGVVKDGILPGFYGYEAGQSGAGDILAWYVKNGVPAAYAAEARARKVDIHGLLEQKAAALAPGESGVLALDWFNGNRSVLVDVDLTGMFVGLSITTLPEEIYRAMIESLAFGTRTIIENFESQGIAIRELYACGGLPEKNDLLMQIFADVTGRTIRVARSAQAPAVGSAMFGAVAAGRAGGGYASIDDAVRRMAGLKKKMWKPDRAHKPVYDRLFAEYCTLHDYFGRGANDVMKRLKRLTAAQKEHGRGAASSKS